MNELRLMRVSIARNGPYVVSGDVPLSEAIIGTDAQGGVERVEAGARGTSWSRTHGVSGAVQRRAEPDRRCP